MGAVDGQMAAVVAVDVPLNLAGRFAERFAAHANAHGGRLESSRPGGPVATFAALPQALQAIAELLLATESPHIRCSVVVLDADPPSDGYEAAILHARRLSRSVEPGQTVLAALSTIVSRESDRHPHQILGRARELETLSKALSAAEAGHPQVLTLVGELGSGRTTMLSHVRDLARARNFGVLQTTGLDGVIGGRWSSLQTAIITNPDHGGPTRLVDRVVSLSGDDVPDDSTVRHELLTQIAVLTDEHPMLVVIDDIDQLDDASLSALRALAAGLAVERCFMVAAGVNEPGQWLDGEVLALRDLGEEALQAIIERDGPIDADVLRRCVQLAGGNALAAREVSRSLSERQRAGQEPLPPVPEPAAAVLAGFRKLLAQSTESAQRAAVVAAADETGDSDVVRAALSVLGEDPAGLEEAEEAGLISLGGSGLRFTHPLLRSVAYHQVAAGSQRAAHKALAVALDRPRQATARAYQLAAAAVGPNEAASEALELIAETELARGDGLTAARACAAAARLTADDALRDQRFSRAASLYLRSGDLASVGVVLAEVSRPEGIADAVVVRCLADLAQRGPHRARSNLGRSRVVTELSNVARGIDAYFGALAGELLPDADPEVPLTMVARVLAGADPASILLDVDRSPGALGALEASIGAHALAMGGWFAEAGGLVRRLEVDPETIDPVVVQAAAGQLALDAGRPIAALEILGDASPSAGATPSDCLRLLALGRARLYCGRLDDADQSLREVTSIVDRLGLVGYEGEIDVLVGLVLHARGREEGAELLARSGRKRTDRALPELVIATLDRDGPLLPSWEAELRALAKSSVPRLSLAARRALAALLHDTAELMSVAKQYEELGLELESTLTRGANVTTAIRAGRPEHVRLQKEMADHSSRRGIFYPGSHYWSHDGPQGRLRSSLSPAEHRVAVAVGTGATNKEVSAQLFISVKTVDYHLQNIYRKLGARSRTELAVLMAGHDVEREGSR